MKPTASHHFVYYIFHQGEFEMLQQDSEEHSGADAQWYWPAQL